MSSFNQPELGRMCISIMEDVRKLWNDMIYFLVRMSMKTLKKETKARDDILEVQKDEQKQSRLFELKVRSLEEIISFKDTMIDMLQSKVESKEREIKSMVENQETLKLFLKNTTSADTQKDRNESMKRLERIQLELSSLTKEYNIIEQEKQMQSGEILKLNLLIKGSFAPTVKHTGIQVDEVIEP